MKAILVLTVIGVDRPGLVDALSRTIREHDANWEQSRMARLGGRFAGILLVSVDAERADALEGALGQLGAAGLRVVVERSDAPATGEEQRGLRIELLGNDRPGIIREISRTLADRGVNIEELETACEEAPMAGGSLFRMRARLRSPLSLSVAELRAAVEAVANDLMVDVSLLDD